MANEAGNSPLPWSVMNDGRTILDKFCSTVAFCERDEDAKLICECVNGRTHLFNVVSEEQEHGLLLEEERDKLRDLVNRLLPLAMYAGEKDAALKPAADAYFKEATALLGDTLEVKDGE